jgi:Zn-dependent peptidase ImmA (M78 family)/DNA-binding XRE family transcriptional regulator
MSSIKAKVNPGLMRWARTSSGLSISEAAKKIGVKSEQIEAWESNEDKPTVVQLRKAAQVYKRPLSTFFLSEIPPDFTIPHDFRRLPGEVAFIYSPRLLLELRQASERREVARDLYKELGEEPKHFPLTATISDNPELIAVRIRDALGVTYEQQCRWRNSYNAFREWKTRLEAFDVLVFQISGIPSSEVRSFALAETVLPVIAVNRGETPTARIFSLLHEFCHLMLRQSSICDFEERGHRAALDERTEEFCNGVAAEALVPRRSLMNEPILLRASRGVIEWSDDDIQTLANIYCISREVIVRRLLTLGRASDVFYRQKRAEYLDEYLASKKKQKEKQKDFGENVGRKCASMLGNFARLVIQSYYRDRITLSDVSGYLGIKLRHLPELERSLGTA